jgi:hypothetical protein
MIVEPGQEKPFKKLARRVNYTKGSIARRILNRLVRSLVQEYKPCGFPFLRELAPSETNVKGVE